jgi:protein arginine N-methyltransferase 3
MLLYESMLDSVLTYVPLCIWSGADLSARDRFLAPGGLMAPSQTRLVLTAITGERLWKEKIDFWNSVYGEHIRLPYSVCTDDRIRHVDYGNVLL